jgi:small conductance mechanosensitive channel
MDVQGLSQNVVVWLTGFGFKVLGAFAFWIVGRWLIGIAVSFITRGLRSQHVDPTLQTYLGSIISVVLNVVLVVAILGFFGIETTSFAALLAAAGIAIGAAWAGLLANFAAGAFLLILRPFKVGDFVSAGGVVGTVEEVGLFATIVNTPDNVRTFIGNNKIFSDTIQNFSANAHRRVDLLAQLDASVDHRAAVATLRDRLGKIPNVLAEPAPNVEILEFTAYGPLLAVRPYCHNDHYWQVYFDTNRMIREAFGEAGYPAPEQRVVMRTMAAH